MAILSSQSPNFAIDDVGDAGANGLYGDANSNRLIGLEGDDFLFGSLGSDLLDGGSGIDAADYGTSSSPVLVSLAGGVSGGDAQGDTLISIENLFGSGFDDALAGDGNDNALVGRAGNDSLSGNDGNDILDGESGSDSLDGGAGSDILRGGTGDDIYLNVDVSDTITEFASEGMDEVRTGIASYTLSANVERLSFTSGGAHQGSGNNGDNILTGNIGADLLLGLGGNDTLIGGLGTNTLQGGTGNDIFIVSNLGDSIIEFANEGIDEVRTAVSGFTLASNVENLTYTGGAAPFLGIGNTGDNAIVGGTGVDQISGLGGNDTLNDGGGAGADTLLGAQGNDIYVIGNLNTSTVELADEGIDEVRTTFSIYGLQNNVENLTFTDNATHGAGVGNSLDNFITGGTGTDDLFGRDGNDTLIGGTGAANTLLGQAGNDIYVVQAAGDSVIEFANEGTDTVQTALASFTLRDNVENLVYTGTGAFTGIGSDGTDNSITGGAGADFLSGLGGNDILIGGSGADILLGGAGADQFRYNGGETGLDRILDFTAGSDKIALANSGFAHTATIAYVAGGAPVATTTNSTFLYNTNTGILSYDADGTGAGAAVQLAQLNTGLTLTVADFVFV